MKHKVNPLHVVQNVLYAAKNDENAKHRRVEETGLDPQMVELRVFQVARIQETYRDFAAQPQYAPVLEFFTNDLYAARDFSQRDHDAQRIHNFLQKFVPVEMLKLTTHAIELTQLSYALDEALLEMLVRQPGRTGTITSEAYAEAYRCCDNLAERARQIDLLVTAMKDAADTAHMPLSGVALKLAKGPAHAAGWHELYAFLERGQRAFAQVKKPERFLEAIRVREYEIMRRIAERDPQPFRPV